MLVRQYRVDDREELISLWRAVFPGGRPHNEPSRVVAEKLAVDDLIFVAEDDGALIGACMAGYDGHRGWLYAMAVLEEHRRGGTGARLVRQRWDAPRSTCRYGRATRRLQHSTGRWASRWKIG